LLWQQQEQFGDDAEGFPSVISSTYNRNFECVYVSKGGNLVHRYFDQSSAVWMGGVSFGPGRCTGRPGFLQSNYWAPGYFEVVISTQDGTLSHWRRDNSTDPLPWLQVVVGVDENGNSLSTFGQNVLYCGDSLLQSHFGEAGNFELVVTLKDQTMQHFYRDNDGDEHWYAGPIFGSNVISAPVMIEGPYEEADELTGGNFELCVAVATLAGGSVQHWSRDQSLGEWILREAFGEADDVSDVVGLVQGSFGFDLEVVVVNFAGELVNYRQDSVSKTWTRVAAFGTR
jgi:hypothetical protein